MKGEGKMRGILSRIIFSGFVTIFLCFCFAGSTTVFADEQPQEIIEENPHDEVFPDTGENTTWASGYEDETQRGDEEQHPQMESEIEEGIGLETPQLSEDDE
jgi:hypothetical protein